MGNENPLSDKGINQTHELDCLRQIQINTGAIAAQPPGGGGDATAANQTLQLAKESDIQTGVGLDTDATASAGAVGSLNAKLRCATGQLATLGGSLDAASAAGGTGSLSAKMRLATSQLDTGNTSLATIITQLSTTGIKVLKPQGAASVSVGAVAVDNTVGGTTIAIARATRRGVLFVNTSTDKTAYVSMGTPTTSSFPLAPGQQLSVTGVGTWKAIMGASDTATVSVLDEYD